MNGTKESSFLVPKKRKNVFDEENSNEESNDSEENEEIKEKLVEKKKHKTLHKFKLTSDENIIYEIKVKDIDAEFNKRLEKLYEWKLKKLTELKENLNNFFEEELNNHEYNDNDHQKSINSKESGFYFFYKNQFLLKNGRNACGGISLTLIYNLLISYKKIEFKNINYKKIIDSGIRVWEIWKQETNASEDFVNVHDILKLEKFEKTRNKLNVIKEFCGSLINNENALEDLDYHNQKERILWTLFDTMEYINLNFFNVKIACSLTLKDYTVTIFKEEHSEKFFLFDSHGIGKYMKMNYLKDVTDNQRKKSLLIEFKTFINLTKYINNRYPVDLYSIKEDFFHDNILDNCKNFYSLTLFSIA